MAVGGALGSGHTSTGLAFCVQSVSRQDLRQKAGKNSSIAVIIEFFFLTRSFMDLNVRFLISG